MKLKRNQKGFTLIEVLVTIGILGAIMGVMSMTVVTIMKISSQSNDQITVLRQVQNAGYWISRDVQMAKEVSPTEAGVFLAIDWDGDNYDVNYVFNGNELRRQLNGSTPGILIAQYIVGVGTDTTFTSPDSDNKCTLTIKAERGNAEVTRVYEISPRPEPNP